MRARSLSWSVVALVVFAGSAVARAEGLPASDEPSEVERLGELTVGMRLVATAEVKLRDVSLVKGARVTVRKVDESKGRVLSADLELADGHVVKRVDLDTIRKSFAAAND